MKKNEKNRTGWYFLIVMFLVYFILFLVNRNLFDDSFVFFISILRKIIPIFVLVFIMMVVVNYFVNPKLLIKYLGKGSGIKGWLLSIVAGIISTGPIYLWYPLLADLKEKGMRNGLVASFLYNRSIKIPLMPLFIFYFGFVYLVILLIITIIMSVFNGIIVEKIVGGKK